MPIDVSKLVEKYKKRAKAAAEDWQKAFLEATGIIAKAISKEAQDLYEAKMKDDKVLKLRQKRLSKLTDEDVKKPVREKGSALYSSGIDAKGDKWAPRFKPFAEVIDAKLKELKPKTTDVEANIDNRVKPIAKALHEKKFEEVK